MTNLDKIQIKLETIAETGDKQIEALANVMLDLLHELKEPKIGFQSNGEKKK